eukprot:TRINITY_DN17443_c0_g1_i1.p1 TRINITY_DN17443_c0_g1~~TRINITY_DN17443_c0_g1_i1.p1  ORF type:complete len:187 (+),score=63.56 TRINITY_DN17443_c0_g1_i1:73-561(+)
MMGEEAMMEMMMEEHMEQKEEHMAVGEAHEEMKPAETHMSMSAAGDAIEKRMDSDGMYYTKEEFMAYYMSNEQWDARVSTSTLGAAAASSSTTAAAGGGTFHKDQSVVSTQDIVLGNTLVVKKGGPGTVLGPSGNGKWQVRFLGVFASAVSVVVDSSQIQAV